MKRQYLGISLCVLIGSVCVGMSTGKTEQDRMDFLGKRFTEALAEDNLAAYLRCWVPHEFVPAMAKGIPETEKKPSDEDVVRAVEYFKERDEEIQKVFTQFRSALKEHAFDPKKITFNSIEGKAKDEMGVRTVSRFLVSIDIGDRKTIKFAIDDGVEVNGVWYFSDKPFDEYTVKSVRRERRHSLSGDDGEEAKAKPEPKKEPEFDKEAATNHVNDAIAFVSSLNKDGFKVGTFIGERAGGKKESSEAATQEIKKLAAKLDAEIAVQKNAKVDDVPELKSFHRVYLEFLKWEKEAMVDASYRSLMAAEDDEKSTDERIQEIQKIFGATGEEAQLKKLNEAAKAVGELLEE